MKTLETTSEKLRTQAQSYRILNNNQNIDVYQYYEQNHNSSTYKVEIQCDIIDDDNYHLLVNQQNLKFIVSEKKEINKPIYVHHYAKQKFEAKAYECLRTFTIKLPHNSNFYIDESMFDKERRLLVVKLKQHFN